MTHKVSARSLRFRAQRWLLVLGAAAVFATVAGSQQAGASGETVSAWLTTTDLSQHLTAQTPLAFSAGSGSASIKIAVNEGRTFQKMLGFGATFTDSSAWLMYTKVNSTTRAAVMQDLFSLTGASGIGLNYLRQPASATDYIKDVGGYYTYDDVPAGQTDPTLSSFSISHDLAYLVPILQQALSVNPAIKVQFNTWTAPAWMKTNGSLLNGGFLMPQYFSTWGNFIVKMIQAYQAQGIPIWATSVQNEPSVAQSYPSMLMPASDSALIIRDSLAGDLAAAGLSTRILASDDGGFDTPIARGQIDSDPQVSADIPATATHGYWGDPAYLSKLHRLYPNKAIYQTELSPGCAYNPSQLLMNTTRNWAQSIVTWNVALDLNNGPFHSTASNTCQPLVRVDQATGAVSYTDAFYREGQASKFVVPGAVRIDTNDNTTVRNVAFKNPDGSKVLVAWNSSGASATFNVDWGNQYIAYTLPANATVTFKWSGTPVGDPAGWGNSTLGTDTGNAFAGGTQTGTWTLNGTTSADQTSRGSGWPSTYFGYADHHDLTVSADLTGVTAGTTAAFPKYGIYACYLDENNYVQAWIDPTSHNYVTHAFAKGTDLGWVNTALPGGFVSTVAHNVKVQRKGDDFTFWLDGIQQQTRTVAIEECQAGLVTEDYSAQFRNVSIIDPSLWGNSQSGADGGNIWDGGLTRGDWAVAGPQSAQITSLGTGWSSIFRGYKQGDNTVSVQAQAVKAGTTSSFPKYGIYASYLDAGNYAQAWIDPTSHNYVTHGKAGGADLGWNNIALPGGFNQNAYHTISVTRAGNVFSFYLDGALQQTRTMAVGNGQPGLVSEDYAANFRKFTTNSDAGVPAFNPNRWYQLFNRRSLRALSVLGGGTTNSTPTIIYDPVAATDQYWKIQATGGGYYQLVNQRSGRLLSVLGGGTANSTDTIIYDNVSATDQYWQIIPAADGSPYSELVNQKSGRALSVFGGGTTNSTHTIIYDYISATDQDWTIVPAP